MFRQFSLGIKVVFGPPWRVEMLISSFINLDSAKTTSHLKQSVQPRGHTIAGDYVNVIKKENNSSPNGLGFLSIKFVMFDHI